jgi:hypothetical protein
MLFILFRSQKKLFRSQKARNSAEISLFHKWKLAARGAPFEAVFTRLMTVGFVWPKLAASALSLIRKVPGGGL